MAGHNKWSKIKHKKAATDAQKSKEFGKMAQILTAESKKCGGDRSSPGLKSAIEQAKSVNMGGKNIDRAIERGVGGESDSMEVVTYEAYGPGGCAMVIETLTDNRNRTAAEVRHIVNKHGFSISAPGSASWMFTKKDGRLHPNTTVTLTPEDAEKLEKIIVSLMEQDDVRSVYSNKT